MRRALLAALLVVVIAVAVIGVVYAAVVRPILLPAPATAAAESALATSDVIVLAGMNVKQAVFLERWLLGTPVIPAAHEAMPLAGDRAFVDHLRAVNVDLRRDIDYALGALYASDTPELRRALLLLGRFDPSAIEQYLTRELGATAHPDAGRPSYDVTRKDPRTCKPSATWRVTADTRWLLLTDPASHASLLQRLTSPPADVTATVSWWRPLARWDVVGIGIWNLAGIDTALGEPFVKASAKAVASEAAPFDHVYVGLGVETTPPRGRLRVVLDAGDAHRALQKITAWEHAVAASRARWVSALPSLGALYDRLSLSTNGARSTIAFSVDRRFPASLQKIGNELLGALFGGFGLHARSTPSDRVEERIDSTPFNVLSVVSPTVLPPYDPTVQFAEEVDQLSGPFGLRLTAIRLGSEPGVGLELTVEGFADQLPNTTAAAGNARLVVDSVKAADGRELLRREDCGRERNAEPAIFTDALAPRLKATKTVRLAEAADPRALTSVTGHVDLRLPTRTETVSISRPGRGVAVHRNNAAFTITDVHGGSLAYQVDGRADRVLAFRALNARGQPLARTSSFTSDFLFGDGMAGEAVYAGTIDHVDVVFTLEEQPLQFPFTLTDFSLASPSTTVVRDTAEAFEAYGPPAIGRALRAAAAPAVPAGTANVVHAPPFELSLDRTQGFIGLMLDFTVRSARLPDFERAFTVGELEVTRIRLRDGTAVEPSVSRPAWGAPIRFGGAARDGTLTTRLRVSTDAKVTPDLVQAVEGRLAVQFPRSLQTLRLEELRPGEAVRSRDFDVTVTGRGRRSLTLQTGKDGHRLLYVRLLTADGLPLAFFGPQVSPSPDGAWRFELSPLSTPRAADVVVAQALFRKAYPFVITTH